MKRWKTLALISLGLTTLTISFLLVGTWIWNMFPQESQQTFTYRKMLVENMAAQYSKLAEKDDLVTIQAAIDFLLARNSDIRSIALVDQEHTSLATAGSHQQYWTKDANSHSTLTHMEVEIYDGSEPWGRLQVAFQPMAQHQGWWATISHDPLYRLLAYITIVGFPGFYFFIGRVLRQLDPSSIVPKRVKTVLDTLVEGVVLLDPKGTVALANAAFTSITNTNLNNLLGKSLDHLPWKDPIKHQEPLTSLPWQEVERTNQSNTGTPVAYDSSEKETKEFIVNSTPILDEQGHLRGILVSLSDVTELSRANQHLFSTLEELHISQANIEHQNEKLQWLATRDPLTGAMNRHAFFELLESTLKDAQKKESAVGCLMLDMDDFKKINDHHGHTAGDRVLKMLAESVASLIRPQDFFGRYGGEEFCVILPGMSEAETVQMGEVIRRHIEEHGSQSLRATSALSITTSIGARSFIPDDPSSTLLIEQADEALYAAKHNGKNQVYCYSNLQTHPRSTRKKLAKTKR